MKTITINNTFLSGALLSFGMMVLSSLSILAWADDDTALSKNDSKIEAKNLVEGMSKAIRELNYHGRFVYSVSGKLSSFQVQHSVIDGKEHERLVFLNEKQREIVRVGHELYCIHPGSHLLRQHEDISSNPFSAKLNKLSRELYDNYDSSIQANKIVAGREALKVSFKSKDTNRYDHSFWIDKDSALLLKADISDPALGVLESFEYVQINIGDSIPLSEFQHEGYVRHSPQHFEPNLDHGEDLALAQQKSKSGWQSTWLPKGFYFTGDKKEELAKHSESKTDIEEQTSTALTMLMYTDGVAAITVFVESVNTLGTFGESSQMGATSAFSHGTNIDGQDYMITAIGEVQLKTVERIAKGVKLLY